MHGVEQLPPFSVPDSPSESLKLGEVPILVEAFELDLKINEGYLAYSKELLRLSLLAIGALATIWLKLYLPDEKSRPAHAPGAYRLIAAFACLLFSAGCSLAHGYTAADSLAYHLTALRRRARNRPSKGKRPSDVSIAAKQERSRDRRFWWSAMLLLFAILALVLGLLLLGAALLPLMR